MDSGGEHIPEETSPPDELCRLQAHLRRAAPLPGFAEAVVDPLAHALACASANARRSQPVALGESRQQLIQQAVASGPDALGNAQRVALLGDPLALSRLHFQVWASPQAHPSWLGVAPASPLRKAPAPRAPEALVAAAG